MLQTYFTLMSAKYYKIGHDNNQGNVMKISLILLLSENLKNSTVLLCLFFCKHMIFAILCLHFTNNGN